MANQEQQQQEKIDHFSHKHPLTLVETEDGNRSFLRCYGCTDKIGSGVPYYRCEEDCPLFCLHHSCAHLPTTIQRPHFIGTCVGDLQLNERLDKYNPECLACGETWYRFAYVCSVCRCGVDIRCARRRPNEAKHSFNQHPVQPSYTQNADDFLLLCSVCSLTIRHLENDNACLYYRCYYCNFIVNPDCTDVPWAIESDSHPHELVIYLEGMGLSGSQICKICQEEIDWNTQWAYKCLDCDDDYYIHAANDDCLTSTIRKGDLQHFDHSHPLALVEEGAPLDATSHDHSIAQECHCCRQKISSVPYYTCVHCKRYHLHKLCAHLPTEIKHPLHPNCPLKLLPGLSVSCDVCDQKSNGFVYHCSPCKYYIDIECAMRTQNVKEIFHKHPLSHSLTKGSFTCHACDRDTEGSSYQCTSCKFWVHLQCASLPTVKETSSHEHGHEHNLELIYAIPEKYSGVVYCRICTKVLKDHRWAYHCNRCRYLTHIHDCFNLHREGNGVTINPSDVVHLPLSGEPILEEKLSNGEMTHPMILYADQFESNAIDLFPFLKNLLRGSATWPTFHVDGIDYSGPTFRFHNSILTMQVTSVDLPRYIKHESHPHVLESTFLNSTTWCHACEQYFFGRGFKCTTCAFTVDTYCALLPRIIKHRYDVHGFSLTYSANEDVEEYVCEICEEDVTPRYFYHCEACDQSIHARCIWRAYVQFEPWYRLDLERFQVELVPPNEKLPKCVICDQKETFGHSYAFLWFDIQEFMVHLTCISEDEVHTC